jgi:hypothetical protein
MDKNARQLPPLCQWGVAGHPMHGQTQSGDQYLVEPFPNGVLAAVADGLGHGPEAATAAQLAVTLLQGHGHEPILDLMRRCHEGLRRTRGVVMTLVSFQAANDTITWTGVGNVEARLLRAGPGAGLRSESLLLRGGVVGYQLPPLRAFVVPVKQGDVLMLATDGIRSDFAEGVDPNDPPQEIADRILSRHGTDSDDALVLTARYVGGCS